MVSQVSQNYYTDYEAAVNKQINLELYSSYLYLSMLIKKLRDYITSLKYLGTPGNGMDEYLFDKHTLGESFGEI
uniref:Ferritin n=1 Tax=Callorhinchus milii TaxID=7868 RepID=A0A4W3K1W8_CALMI